MKRVPHRYPFVWIDALTVEPASESGPATARAKMRLTSTSSALRDGTLPNVLTLEMMAQAAIGIVADDQAADEARQGYLAGLDRVTFLAALLARPLVAGDVLEVVVERTASFGAMVKVKGAVHRDGEALVEGELVLTSS